MHRDDRHHVPAAALRGLERGDVAGASAFLAQGGEVDARGPQAYAARRSFAMQRPWAGQFARWTMARAQLRMVCEE